MSISQERQAVRRRMPIGAELQPGGADFRVWAPLRSTVEVVFPSSGRGVDPPHQPVTLLPESEGYFSRFVPGIGAGTLYGYRLDGSDQLYPDPASRHQPQGPHGPSAVIDPDAYSWGDSAWPGVRLPGQVIYEMHIGTFTPRGTWEAATAEIPRLAELGVTLLEVMPVAEFDGRFGWGYDGVDLFAPTQAYGTPDDFRRFVDTAHQHGLGVMLDVVYNHFGPSGNYIGQFSDKFRSQRHSTEWGDAINFDGEDSRPVREFFISNAGYWVDEYHIDGLRLDAVQAIVDDSRDHVVAAIVRRVREAAAGRDTLVIIENERQDARMLRPVEQGGCGVDAAWNDDFHHSARVAATGRSEYYYGDYRGTPQELISAVKFGYLYQGQWNSRQGHVRGWPALDLPGPQFVVFLQNHDQVGNSAHGWRVHRTTSPGRHRALTALLLLSPGTPLLFQGQEFSASSQFLYFADHPDEELGRLVRTGRHNFMRNFRSLAGPDADACLADPGAEAAFQQSKLELSERESNAACYRLHGDLLRLRRQDQVFAAQRADRIHGAVLGPEALALRYVGNAGDDRLLIVNLGADLRWTPAAEPLLAPPADSTWRLLWSSENPCYEGSGMGLLDPQDCVFPGHAAVVFAAHPDGPEAATGKLPTSGDSPQT